MKPGLIILLFLLLFSAGLRAQEVVNSAGNFLESPAGSISWSLGEVTVFTISGSDAHLTQGFQQPLCPTGVALACPANISIDNQEGLCSAVVDYAMPTIIDNCGPATLTQSAGLPSGSTFDAGTTTNVFVATDASGRSTSCSFTVTVIDAEAPIAVCPFTIPDVVLDANGNGALPANIGDGSSSDNCGFTETSLGLSFTCDDLGPQTVVLTVADAANNSAETTCFFNVVDHVLPSISCPSDITVGNDAGVCEALVTGLGYTGASDNCSFTVEWMLNYLADEPGVGGSFSGSNSLGAINIPVGTATLTYTIEDAANNSANCSVDITIQDTEDPTISCPTDIAVDNDPGNCGATVSYLVTSNDNCSWGVSHAQSAGMASGALFPVGATVNNFVATDHAGHSATCSFVVTVNDTEGPNAVCQNITVQLDLNGVASITANQVDGGSTDNCGIESMAVSPDAFDATNLGPNTVSLTVTDAHGHSSSCDATVTVGGRATTVTYTGDQLEQYSDLVQLSATLVDQLTGAPLSGRELIFSIGTQSVGAITNASGLASATMVLYQPPTIIGGPGTVVVSFSPAAGDLFLASSDTDAFEVQPENALVTYTGALFASTGGANNSQAIVTLTATIQDIADGYPGNISNAKVLFFNSENDAIISDTLNVALINPADPSIGTVLYNWPVNIGNSDGETFEIGIKVIHYYTRKYEADATITVSKPLNDFFTGGGFLYLENSLGTYAGDNGTKCHFSLNAKFNPSGNQPKGKFHFLVRRLEPDGLVHTYRFKSNKINSIGMNPPTDEGTVTGKCNIQDVTDPNNPISLGGNKTFQVDVQDNGNPGTLDSIAIAVYSNGGALLFSSKWSDVQTVYDTLDGGNIQVHYSNNDQNLSELPGAAKTAESSKQERAFRESLLLFPNPTRKEVNLTIDLADDKDVRVEVVAANGQIVRMQAFTLQQGVNTLRFDLQGLPAGAYWVRATGQDTLLTTTLLVVE